MARRRRSVQRFSPRRVLPPSHAGPPPPPPPQNPCHHRQIHASRPPTSAGPTAYGHPPPQQSQCAHPPPRPAERRKTSSKFRATPSPTHPPRPSGPVHPAFRASHPPKGLPSPDASTPLDRVSIRVDMRFSRPRREKTASSVSAGVDSAGHSGPPFKSPDPLNKYILHSGSVRTENVRHLKQPLRLTEKSKCPVVVDRCGHLLGNLLAHWPQER
jgi:hypothetical protein